MAFLVYHLTALGPTPFNGPVILADAFLHGRLDISNGKDLYWMDWAVYKGKYYIVEPPMTAVVTLPGVILFGTALNQSLVSTVIGAINASAVHRLMRGLTDKLSSQVWLTLLFVFGTAYWWTATNGGIWYFAHTLGVLFLFLAIYETLIGKRPFTAGLLLGAAYQTRLPTILTLPFFVIMFSDQWLQKDDGRPLLKRVDLKPLLLLGAGLGIFVVLGAIYNYLRFETPLHASYYYWLTPDAPIRQDLLKEGLFDASYIPRHIPVVFRSLPIFQSKPPYVVASWGGMAMWATTPVFLYALFAGIRDKVIVRLGAILLFVTLALFGLTARGLPSSDFAGHLDPPYGLEFYPFAFLIAYGLFAGIRHQNKLVVACWSAIIPTAFVHFAVGVTGWPQFGYRFALDYYPFLFLLLVAAIGDRLKWHHKLLIVLSVMINFGGVLWTYHFEPSHYLGLQWVSW